MSQVAGAVPARGDHRALDLADRALGWLTEVPAAVLVVAEVAILFAWALTALELGIPGMIAATVFILVLLAALGYLWMDGALETAPEKRS